MKYFLDTEFIEGRDHLDLISIGLVREYGPPGSIGQIYAENSEVDWSRASSWVLENVRPHLNGLTCDRATIAATLKAFVGDDPSPEFWGYYASWDWTALCWLMGGMFGMPQSWPMFCRDLRQALDERGLHHVKQPDDAPHNALSDAQWVARTYAEYFPDNAPPSEDA